MRLLKIRDNFLQSLHARKPQTPSVPVFPSSLAPLIPPCLHHWQLALIMAVKNGAVTPATPPPPRQHSFSMTLHFLPIGARSAFDSLPLLSISLFSFLSGCFAVFCVFFFNKEQAAAPSRGDLSPTKVGERKRKKEISKFFSWGRQMGESLRNQCTSFSQMEPNFKTQLALKRTNMLHHCLMLWHLWYITRLCNDSSMRQSTRLRQMFFYTFPSVCVARINANQDNSANAAAFLRSYNKVWTANLKICCLYTEKRFGDLKNNKLASAQTGN